MKSRITLATLSALLCASAVADPVYLPPGPNLTYGSSSNNQSIMSSVANPAAPAAELGREDGQYRFGILSIGAGYEFGNVGQFYNTIDSTSNNTNNALANPIDATTLQQIYVTDCPLGTCNANFAPDIAAAVNNSQAFQDINHVLTQLQQDGNVSVYGDVHVPFTPFVVSKKGLGGSFVLDANVSTIANMTLIRDPLAINTTDALNIANSYNTYIDPLGNNGNGTYTLPPLTSSNDSTMVVKAAAVVEVGLGYSRLVLSREKGDLTAGVRGKYYKVGLMRDAQRVDTSNGAQNTFDASKSYTNSSGIGLDLGTLWTAKHYRLGAWVNNINSPSFKYNAVDPATLASYDPSKSVKALLSAGDTYKMEPQLEMEGALYSESQNWVLNAGLDANAVPDPVGRDFQWMTLSAAYATDSWWIPGIRAGYRANLAGSKLSYLTAGLTMFKALSLDIAYGLSSISDNSGHSIPRSAMINLGLQMTF